MAFFTHPVLPRPTNNLRSPHRDYLGRIITFQSQNSAQSMGVGMTCVYLYARHGETLSSSQLCKVNTGDKSN